MSKHGFRIELFADEVEEKRYKKLEVAPGIALLLRYHWYLKPVPVAVAVKRFCTYVGFEALPVVQIIPRATRQLRVAVGVTEVTLGAAGKLGVFVGAELSELEPFVFAVLAV